MGSVKRRPARKQAVSGTSEDGSLKNIETEAKEKDSMKAADTISDGTGGETAGELCDDGFCPLEAVFQRVELAVEEDFSASDQDNPARQGLDVLHIVGRQNHRRAALAVEFAHEFADGEL